MQQDRRLFIVLIGYFSPVIEGQVRVSLRGVVEDHAAMVAGVKNLDELSQAVVVLNVSTVSLWWMVEETVAPQSGQGVKLVTGKVGHNDSSQVAIVVIMQQVLLATGQDNISWLKTKSEMDNNFQNSPKKKGLWSIYKQVRTIEIKFVNQQIR